MGIINRLSGPKLWWFHFSAEPLPEGPDHARFVRGYIDVWVAQSDGIWAEKIARDAVAKTQWQIVRLVSQKYGSRKICRRSSRNLEHFQRAIANGHSVDFWRSQRDPDEEDESEEKDKAPVSVATPQAGIQVLTETRVDDITGATITHETISRDGQTRLLRTTSTKGPELIVRTQIFYYGGEQVAVFVQRPELRSESFTTLQTSCQVTLDFSPTKDIEKVIVSASEGGGDSFSASNGIFQLLSDADLRADEAQ